MQHIQRHRIQYLYHLTHLINLPTLFSHGLLSHNEAHRRGVVAADLSDEEVQLRRRRVAPNRRPLHDYVPLYFTPKNPMLFARRDEQESIVILGIASRLLLHPDTLFTDGNAAAQETRFYRDTAHLDRLHWNVLHAHFWTPFIEGKRLRCAEALVYRQVPLREILKVYCYSEATKLAVRSILWVTPPLPGEKRIGYRHLEVNRSLYFDD
ncbi:MAG: DUF4433 domain-containing protein [Armatimonadetes bacterium]|nr:DUF4433 domain-containing protein [Armatimonadota bacterium]